MRRPARNQRIRTNPTTGRLPAVLAFFLTALLAAPFAQAGPDRPVVIPGRALPHLLGEPVAGLRLLAWIGGRWRPVPYQIDPRIRSTRPGHAGRLIYLLGSPGKDDPAESHALAGDDEVVFMARDLGTSPPPGGAPRGSRAGAILSLREREAAGARRFAGLFVFDAPPPRSGERHVRYDPERDQITARSYTLAFPAAYPVVFETLRVHPPGVPRASAPPPDLLDRVKIRIRGRILGAVPFHRNETDFRTVRDGARGGPVRVVRGSLHRLPAVLGMRTAEVRQEEIFYPDSFEFPVWFLKSKAMGRLLTHLSLRAGPDWSPAARGMRVHVPGSAAPFIVDGRMEGPERDADLEGASWSVLEDGKVAIVSRISAPGAREGKGGFAYRLYYRDALDDADPPERYPGQTGALAFEFPDLDRLPPGAHRWTVRTGIFAPYARGHEAAMLSALDPVTTARVSPFPPLQDDPPRAGRPAEEAP